MHVGNYNSTRRKVSEGDLNYCCLKSLRTDYGQTHVWAWECVPNAVPSISSHLISYDVPYCTCQQFEKVRSVAQIGMGSI